MAKSFSGIEFLRDNGLCEYVDEYAPVVVFGGHYPDTINVIKNHKGAVVINWTGADSKRCKDIAFYTKSNIINVTTMPNVQKLLGIKGINCYMIRFSRKEKAKPLMRGDKVYTYIHHLDKAKYNEETVRKIKTTYEIMIARLDISKEEWYKGKCDEVYRQCFIGLALSDFTGATGSVLEMGMRGIKAVTNVVNLPNCISWKSVTNIEKAISEESVNIGTEDKEMAEMVADEIIIGAKYFDLNKLMY